VRKFILIAALVLASASAQAGGSRGLTLAANDDRAATTQPEPAPAPSDAPRYVERPSAVGVKAATNQRMMDPRLAAKAKRRHVSLEARVIYELHRHGIYW
jgi:hypothetical protein